MGLPRPLYVYFRSFQTQNLQKKTEGFSGTPTWIVGVEGKHADHLTTTTTTTYLLIFPMVTLACCTESTFPIFNKLCCLEMLSMVNEISWKNTFIESRVCTTYFTYIDYFINILQTKCTIQRTINALSWTNNSAERGSWVHHFYVGHSRTLLSFMFDVFK